MGKVKDQQAAYNAAMKGKQRQGQIRQRREYILNDKGDRVGVIIDLPSYEKLLEAQEDREDIRDFDEHAKRAISEYRRGEYVTLEEYARQRKTSRR
jgi:hypothetical protein